MTLINDSAEIRRIMRPLAKRWWFILLMCGFGAYKGYNSFLTEAPSFQARATIQINDKNSSPSVFLEHFEAFSMVGKYVLEMELIRSTYLIRKAIKKLPLRLGFWEMKENRWMQYYKLYPFEVSYQLKDSSWLDIPLFLEIHTDGAWELKFTEASGQEAHMQISPGDSVDYRGLKLSINNAPNKKDLPSGSYKLIIRSEEALMGIFADLDNLLVRLQDEKVSLINIYYWHPVPAVATDYVNALAQTYMEDFLLRKREMANRALEALKGQTQAAEIKLQAAESALFEYRDQVKIWDVSSFRKLHLDLLSESETRRLNTNLKIHDLQNLSSILDSLNKNEEGQLNYESVRDKGYQNALEQIGKLQNQLKKSRLNLTENHPKILMIRREIGLIIQSLQSSTVRTLETYQQLNEKLNTKAETAGEQILRLPEVEQNLSLLSRQVAFRQRALDSLNIKMVDAYISTVSNFSFHRILEHEIPPEEPIKPLFHVKVGVTSLMFTLYAAFILLFLQAIKGVITDAEDVDEHLEIPVRAEAALNPFPQQAISQGIINLAADLILDQEVQVVTLFDFQPHPDKFESSLQLAYVLAELDKKTLLLDASVGELLPFHEIPSHPNLDILNVGIGEGDFPAKVFQHKDWEKTLTHLCRRYDYVIYVMSGIKESQEVISPMMTSDLNLYVAGMYRSKISHLQKVQDYLQVQEVPHAELLLLSRSQQSWVSRLKLQIISSWQRLKKHV